MKSTGRFAIGIDLGGTFIKGGVVDSKGRIISRVSVDTEVHKGLETVVGNIASAAVRAAAKSQKKWRSIGGIGLGSPGIFDFKKGAIISSPNLKCLEGQPLARLVKKQIGRDIGVFLENDANAAAYGEQWAGVGRRASSLVLFTLGTGIGGGVVLDGKIWHGSRGLGAELGHQTIVVDGVQCGCGNRGCLEAYASAPATVRRFEEAVRAGRSSALADMVTTGQRITSRDIYVAAINGDDLSRETLAQTGAYLGVAVANMIAILDPEMIVFTGGMTAAGKLLLDAIKQEAERCTFGPHLKGVKIVFGKLGNDAGLIGAAGCAFTRYGISA